VNYHTENINTLSPINKRVLIFALSELLRFTRSGFLTSSIILYFVWLSIIAIALQQYVFGGTLEPIFRMLNKFGINPSGNISLTGPDILNIYGKLSFYTYILTTFIRILIHRQITIPYKILIIGGVVAPFCFYCFAMVYFLFSQKNGLPFVFILSFFLLLHIGSNIMINVFNFFLSKLNLIFLNQPN